MTVEVLSVGQPVARKRAKLSVRCMDEEVVDGADEVIYTSSVEEVIDLPPEIPELPELRLPFWYEETYLDDCAVDDFELIGYDPLPGIKAEVAV